MHVPAGLGEKRRHMANGTLGTSAEEFLPAPGCRMIVRIARWGWRIQRQLIEMEIRKFWRYQVYIAANIVEAIARRNGKARRVRQTRIIEGSFPVHFEIGNKSVPMRHGTPPGPGVKIDSRQSESGRD